MTDFGSYDDYYGDPYAQDASLAGQYYSPQQLALMQQLMGQGQPQYDTAGLDPTMGTMMGNQFLPQLDTKGRAQPYDLGYAAQLMNFGQDMGSSVGNNVMAYMSGPGAYAPGALDPVYDEKPLAATQGYQLQAMRQSGGIRGTIADLILGGMNAGQAASRVRQMLKNPEKYANIITPAEAADMRNELDIIPADPMNGVEESPDFNSINKIADNIYNPYLQEQGLLNQPNVRMNADGQYVQVTKNDSPQMEWLKKMGLPDPRASYDVKFALENDPSLAGMLSSVATNQSERDLMRKEFEDRFGRLKKYREDDVKDARTMERFKGATQQALSEYFGAASRGQARRPDMPAGVGDAGGWTPPSAATLAAQQQASSTPLTWQQQAGLNARLPQVGPEAEQYMRDPTQPYSPSQAMDNLGVQGTRRVPTPIQNNLPSYINGGQFDPTDPTSGVQSGSANVIRDAVQGAATGGVTPGLPDRPQLLSQINGITPADPNATSMQTLMDNLLGKPMREVMNYQKARAADEAVDPATRARMYTAQQKGIDKKGSAALFKYMMGLAPTVVAGRQGRSPRTDAIQQRLAPLYGIGALGQR